jgi:carboxypeptidase T
MTTVRIGTACLLFISLLSCLLAFGAFGASGVPADTIVRILAPTPELARSLESEGFDVTLALRDRLEVRIREGDLEKLAALGIAYEILDKDLIPGGRAATREGNLDPQYHTYAEMVSELLALEATYPDICKVYDIGDAQSMTYTWGNYSHQYDIWALRISDNPEIDEPEPCVVYDGRHHAREPVSTEIVLAVAAYYCENYGIYEIPTMTVDNTEIWIVPMVNPDGHQWVEDVDPWWRKNLYDYNQNQWVDDYEGIDPNRNYDWHWTGGSWYSETYGGPSPWSAPEVVSLRDLFEQHRTCLNASYHSYGEVVLYPFGYGVNPEPAVIEVATEFANRIGYDPERSTTAHGSSKDWAYGKIGAVSFTVETAEEFIPSGTQMQQIVEDLLPGSVWLATRASGPSVQGTVTDAVTGLPLAATIHIPEIQNFYGNGELWDMETESATGYFCRLRPQATGTVTLEVSADGYQSATVPVTTGGVSATVVNIELMPEGTGVARVTGAGIATTQLGSIAPQPATPRTTLSFQVATRGPVTIRLYDVAGRAVRTLVDRVCEVGEHRVPWDGCDDGGRPAASGVYLARLEAGRETSTRRVVLLR